MHPLRKYKLNRRTMLRGMVGGGAVTVGLPLLEVMLNESGTALADGSALPTRFMTWYWADGIVLDLWEPQGGNAAAGVHPNWELSTQLQPLAPVKDYVSVLTGLRNRCAQQMTHHEGMTAFNGYSYVPQGGLNSNCGGPTIDQRVADCIAGDSIVRAVHVRVSKRESTDGDGGTTVLALSHRGEPGNLTAQIPERNPQQVWQTLFGEFVPKPDDRDLRTSILDHVREDAQALKSRVGMTDQQRIDAHLEGVFELENKILADSPSCTIPNMPTETNTDTGGVEPISSVNNAMAELIRYAFVCDLTRVATFLFKKFVSGTVFDEIGAGQIHHNASHQGPDNQTYRAGITYQMERFADLLQLFMETEEADGGNLLDSTIIYASSDCSTGSSHSIQRQPILLAGTGRGYLAHPGIHYNTAPWNGSHSNPNGSGNMSDVLLTCLQAFDPNATDVGGGEPYSDTPLTEVLA